MMISTIMSNNSVEICGQVVSGFEFSHSAYGENFYLFYVSTKRFGTAVDVIPVLISECLVDFGEDYPGKFVSVKGQFRSYNKHEEFKNKLILSVFAREFKVLESEIGPRDNNIIILEGCVCKKPIYRETPLRREISDVLLAVNRPYGKSDYIPCICWGRNALRASYFETGTIIRIHGRIQSREYQKQLSNKNFEKRTAYEVSISQMEVKAREQK